MNADKMETPITSETISQQKFPEIAKKVLQTGNKGKEHSNERITEIEQTDKDLNKARKVYFDSIKSQKKSMAHMKYSVKKKCEGGKQTFYLSN